METFLPSEISRLVLGYLKEENCHETAKVFMRECVHLAEYLSMLHQGREFSTEVAGLSLKMILDEYGNMKLSRRVQAAPATLTNLWDKYELMGSQLRQAITPQVNPTPQPTPQPIASQFVNSMHSFSRRQGARNRYTSARTEGVLVVRQEVAITTASAVLTTPRSVTGANIAGTFTFPASLPPLSHPAPGGTRCGAIESRAPTWSSAGRRSVPMSQMEDDLESLVSVCSSMSSVTFDRIECNVVTDHNAANDLGGDRLNRMLTIADQVLHEENARPAKIISPTSQSPLSSTHLSASTPGNLPKTSRRSAASSAATDGASVAQISIKPKRSRRIQTKMMGDGAVLSPIRAPISVTSCHAAPATSHPSTLVGSGPVASHTSLAPCGYGTALSSSVVPMKTQSSETNVEMSSWNPVTSGTPGTVTPPFQLFALGSDELRSAAAMFNAPSVLSYPVVSVSSSNSDPATSFDAVPVYTVPFDPCNSGLVTSDAMTSFGNVPVTCNMVPVTSCNSVPSNQVPVTITSVSANTLDQVQCGVTATSPSVVPAVGTPPKRRSGSNRVDNGSGDTANPQVPLTSVRLRRHMSKEFCSPRDRRKKAQPCRRRTLAEQVFGRGCTTSNTSSSVLLCNGSASSSSAFNCSHAKTDVSDLDINAEMLERLLSSHSIAEKIAENINRLTSHGTSRSDPGPSNCPGTATNTTSNTLSHNPGLAVETTSISLPFDLSRQGKEFIAPSINGCKNGLEKEISEASNTMTPVVSTDSGSYREKSLLRQECPLDRMNLHQPRREETISDLSCTSLLSLSNLDQMTDDAVRFVFDQLCNDPNLDSICSTTTYHNHTERTEVDVIDSGVISNRTSASFSNSHVELVNSEPIIDVPTAAHEMASLAGGDLRSPSVQHGMDPPASASAGFDMRPCYIKVLFPGPNGHPERIDIVEVIGSGVEIDGQSSPDGTMSVTDGSIPLVNNSQETAGENPMLMSSQGMSSYLHSSTQVTSTLVEPSVSGWSIPDPTPCSNAFDNHAIPVGTVAYFGANVAAADFPEDVSETEAAVQGLVSASTDPSLQKPTIAESDLGGLRTLVAPSPCEDTHLLIDLSALQPSPAKVVSHASSPAMKSGPGFPDPGLWHKREKSAADYSPCKVAELGRTQDDSKKRKKHHPGNAIKVPEVELKLDETTGGYRLTCDRMEKRRRLGFGVPGKIPESKSPESIATVQTNLMLTSDVLQFQRPASSSTGGCGSGSVPVFKKPDSKTDCITVSDIPSLLHSQEEAVDFSRKDARGSKEQSGVLGRFRGSSTLSSVSTGSFTAGGISGPSTMSGGVVDASSSPVGSVHGVVNPLGRVVEYPSHGVAGPPTVCRSVVDSAGLPGDPVSPNVITSSPASSGSAESLSASIGSAGPCDPTESSGPCGPTESAKAPSTSASAAANFTRSVIVPSGATGDKPPRNLHNATDERSGLNKRSVSRHKSKSARDAKSAVVYLEHVELSLCKEKLEGCDPSFLSAAFPPIHRTPSVSSDHALPSETPHKTTPRPKKKSKRTSDSGKNKSGHSNKKGKAHSSHNSMGKQAGEYGKAEKSRGASDATKAIQRDRKERETKCTEAISNAVQYNIVSSDDDDLPIAYLIKSGTYRDLSSKYTKENAGPATDKQSPHSTPQETLSNKESLEKDKRSGSSAKASGEKSSTQNSCKGLGEKVKTTREEQSKTTREESGKTTREERSKTAREEQSRTARIEQSKTTREEQSKFTRKEQSKTTRKEQSKPSKEEPWRTTRKEQTKPAKEEPWRITREEQSKPTKEEPGKTTRKEQSKPTKEEPGKTTREEQSKPTRKEQLSDFSAITISDDSSLSDYSLQPNAPYAVSQTAQTSDERDGRCDKNTEPQLVVDVPGHFKIPKLRHSLPGRTSTWNTDHRYPSYRKSMDEVLSERWTSTASEEIPGFVPGKSHVTPLPSTPNPRNTSLPLSSKSVEHIHSDLRTSKTVVRTPSVDPSKSQTTSDTHASKPKPRPMVPSESFKPRVHIASNLVTLKPMVEIQGISRPKSQINSSKTTLVASAPDLQTASTPDPRTASAPDPRTASAPVPRAAYMPDPRTTYTPDRGTTSAPDPRTASTPNPWTASSSTVSSIPPSKNSESIARNAKSPKKSDCDKTQKCSSSGRSILLSPEESLNAHKRSKTKPSSKTKKTDQTIVSKQPVPSLLSRARKVREVSTCSEGLSYGTLLSMPSSLENLRQSLNKGEKETAPWDDDPIQIDSETERLETNTFVESGDGDDDVVIASALLSLSNSVPGNSGFTNIRQNGKSTETASSCFEDAGQSNRNSSDAGFEICRDPFPRYKTSWYNGESGLTNSDPEILYEKDTPGSSQAEITCSYDSGCVDLTTATRDFDLDGCSMKDLRTSSFSSPSIGLVVNIDEGSVRTPSSPSTSTSACPSVPESHVDEFPGSWPSEEISKMSGKRRRSPSADSDQKTRKLRKKLKGLDITAFLKQLHQPKNSN